MSQGFTRAGVNLEIDSVIFSGITIGSFDQGAPAALVSGWPVKITDGLNVLGTPLNPLEVSGFVGINYIPNLVVTVSGVVTTSGNALPDVAVTNFPNPLTVNGAVAISGTPTVNVSNFPALQDVTGTVSVGNTPNVNVLSMPSITVAVSGVDNVTVSNFPNPLTVNGTVAISGEPTVLVGNFPGNQNVTVTNSVIPVSGNLSVTVNPPALQAVSGVVIANQGSPSLLASGWPVEITDGTNILGTVFHPINITGTVTTSITAVNQGSPTPIGSGWPVIYDRPTSDPYSEAQFTQTLAPSNSIFTVVPSGLGQTIRVYSLIATASVQTVLTLNSSQPNGATPIMPLPPSGTIILDLRPAPWCTTPASSGFTIQSSAANTTLNATVYYTRS